MGPGHRPGLLAPLGAELGVWNSVASRVSGGRGPWKVLPCVAGAAGVMVELFWLAAPLAGCCGPVAAPPVCPWTLRVLYSPCRPQEARDAGAAVAVGHDPAGEHAHRLPLPAHHPQHEGTAPAPAPACRAPGLSTRPALPACHLGPLWEGTPAALRPVMLGPCGRQGTVGPSFVGEDGSGGGGTRVRALGQ